MARSVGILIYPDFQLLDAAGPIGAFTAANRFVPGAYAVSIVALRPGKVISHSGAAMHAEALPNAPLDTLLVVGGAYSRMPVYCVQTQVWLKKAARRARRVTSVCNG